MGFQIEFKIEFQSLIWILKFGFGVNFGLGFGPGLNLNLNLISARDSNFMPGFELNCWGLTWAIVCLIFGQDLNCGVLNCIGLGFGV